MKNLALALVFFIFAAPANAYRRPKNYRRRPKSAAVARSTETVKSAGDSLPPGRWDPEVRAALMRFVLEKGAGSSGYDGNRPPVAVIPFENAAVAGDPAELVFLRMARRADFRFSEEFWKEVPIAYGRQRLRAAYEQFSAAPPDIWEQQPTYHQYLKGFVKAYQDMCVKIDRKDCRDFLARLFIGFTYEDAEKYAASALDEERVRPPGTEEFADAPGDPAPARLHRGIGDVPEIRALAAYLQANGVDVWLEGLEASPVLEAAASDWGVKKDHLISIRQGRFRERLDGSPVEPIPIRGGLVDAVVQGTGHPPELVVGATLGDAALMAYGSGLRVALSGGDKKLAVLAKMKGWLVQPPF